MKKKAVAVFLLIIMLLSFSACWSKSEPKELGIITSIVYDVGKTQKYRIIIEILNPMTSTSQSSAGTSKPSLIKITEGMSHAEATRNATETLARRIYGANNKIRFFSEQFAQNHMKEILDFFLRDHLTDERPLMVVVKGNEDALKLYDAHLGLFKTVGVYAESLLRTRDKKNAYSVLNTTLDFMKDYTSEGKQPVMAVVELVPNDAKLPSEKESNPSASGGFDYLIKFEGLAVFKEDKLVGYLDKYQARAYNFLVNEIKYCYIDIPVVGGLFTVMTNKSKTKIKTSFDKGKVTIDVKVKSPLRISQNQTDLNVSEYKTVKMLENAYNIEMENEIMNAILKVQKEYKSDIFGFGNSFHSQNPKEWKNIKDKWDDEYFANAKIKVSVEADIKSEGEIKQNIGWKSK